MSDELTHKHTHLYNCKNIRYATLFLLFAWKKIHLAHTHTHVQSNRKTKELSVGVIMNILPEMGGYFSFLIDDPEMKNGT